MMFDLMEYMNIAFPTKKPTWTSDNEIIYRHPAFLLRQFRITDGEPTLIIPPQAGHSSHIADYDEGQSLIATVMANREGPVYCIEWLSCPWSRRRESIGDLVKQVLEALSYCGPQVHLIGLCQGGWLSSIVAAISDHRIASLTCIAAPIDFHASGGIIYDTVTELGMEPYKFIVNINNGIMPGTMMLLGWKMMHPVERYIGDYIDIFTDMLIDNKEKMGKIKKFRAWYEYVQDIAGAWYLEAVEHLFLKNELIKGEFYLFDSRVDLGNITCPIAMIAGGKDDITLEPQLYSLGLHASSSDQYMKTIPECGHIGCFMGSKSQAYIADSIQWLEGLHG